ncbi:hypothetical protein BT96DRAFT_985360 [Gymnopus androsaceus JB14]|uniref:Uncharacterized protein n=1 Tax=Gymnopus androsaceus JB14 TaxID=1447944 RepID=A0A6A4IJ62_9AGAR|nr:hypothetical protein BT96DRAFT_985360 [Gymnopus androsaceus JB14]
MAQGSKHVSVVVNDDQRRCELLQHLIDKPPNFLVSQALQKGTHMRQNCKCEAILIRHQVAISSRSHTLYHDQHISEHSLSNDVGSLRLAPGLTSIPHSSCLSICAASHLTNPDPRDQDKRARSGEAVLPRRSVL